MYKTKKNLNPSLKDLHTFSIDVTAKNIIFVKSIKLLVNTIKHCKASNIPYIILGEGSNVLFLKNYVGIVIINRIKGIQIIEKNQYWLLHIFSGEKWNKLVKYTLNLGIFGLENLALIPGCVGSAAIQNIGAYGSEFKDICLYVDVLFLGDYTFKRMNAKICQFSYRNSIFKRQYKNDYVIIAIGIKLLKLWKPIIFSDLKDYIQKKDITAEKIFNIICKIRINKLPNPKITGNAGSFFKNPIIDKKQAYKIISSYNILYYPQKNGLVKISGSGLIQNCKFNNIKIGDATIHETQKLILINKNRASGKELLKIAKIIHTCVLKKFNIFLNPEIDFIGSKKKIHPLNIF